MRDVLALARIPHPAAFPMQASVFGATGAVWGRDPYGGPVRPGTDWPRREAWRSEVGFSALYQPGLPDPASFVSVSLAIPVGSSSGGQRLSVSYGRSLDFLRAFGH